MLENHKRLILVQLIGDTIVAFDKTVKGGASIPRMLLLSRMFEAYYQGYDLSISEAVNQSVTSTRSMKRVIDQLESEGLIRSYKCKEDARVKRLCLDSQLIYNMRQSCEPLWQKTVKNLTDWHITTLGYGVILG